VTNKSLQQASTTTIEEKILTIRGQRILLDFELAQLYEVKTKALKQAVKRNIRRSPADFMFELTKDEWLELVTNCDHIPVSLKHSYIIPTDASSDELAQVKVLADGFAIFWENIDVVLSVPDLLMGAFGSKTWMARLYSEIGRKGGSKTSAARAKASKTNGLPGGRPRKVSAP
jgi:hypothetical protein